jgi:hypothetical protein
MNDSSLQSNDHARWQAIAGAAARSLRTGLFIDGAYGAKR